MPAASVSATVVELNRRLRGADPFTESTVSQIGRVVVSTVKNGVPEEAPTTTSARPAVPEPFTYVKAADVGVTVNGVGAITRKVTGTTLFGAGAFNNVIVVEFVVPTAKPPQPAVATALTEAGVVALALRATSEVTVAHAWPVPLALPVVSIVNGVPPLANVTAEATEVVCAVPGVYAEPL